MQFSPYFLLIAIGCFGGAALMFTRFRDQAAITYPTGVLLILGGVYLLCREFVRGFAGSQAASWATRGVLVIFLIYLLLCWNNLKSERNAEFDRPESNSESHSESRKEETPDSAESEDGTDN
jgi:hypothetical protein